LKIINRRTFYQTRTKADGTEYTIYIYEVKNGHELIEATSLQEFEVGEKVRTWFDEKYNTAKVGKLCQKCLAPAKSLPLPEHEFCQPK
jgi:hypothetical protein